jgi:hypothetical protein
VIAPEHGHQLVAGEPALRLGVYTQPLSLASTARSHALEGRPAPPEGRRRSAPPASITGSAPRRAPRRRAQNGLRTWAAARCRARRSARVRRRRDRPVARPPGWPRGPVRSRPDTTSSPRRARARTTTCASSGPKGQAEQAAVGTGGGVGIEVRPRGVGLGRSVMTTRTAGRWPPMTCTTYRFTGVAVCSPGSRRPASRRRRAGCRAATRRPPRRPAACCPAASKRMHVEVKARSGVALLLRTSRTTLCQKPPFERVFAHLGPPLVRARSRTSVRTAARPICKGTAFAPVRTRAAVRVFTETRRICAAVAVSPAPRR